MLSARVMAVILCFPALSSSSVMNFPTWPPACLELHSILYYRSRGRDNDAMTYPNDCNFLDMIFQTLRLLADKFVGHNEDILG